MKLIFFTLALFFCSASRANILFCDGAYLKNEQGQVLAINVNCEAILLKSREGLFCDGAQLTNTSGRILAISVNCDEILRTSRRGFFCADGQLTNFQGEILAISLRCEELLQEMFIRHRWINF